MAEEGSVYELEGLEKQLQSLLGRYTSDELRADNKPFCSDFCKLVEEHASRWQVPLPQLRILDVALSYFTRASTFFASNCDHVLHTLSSLALSVFELLLFFDQKDLHQEPLKHFTVTFQECHLALARHQNVHLLQVERLVRSSGPWACPALQAILSESSLPQSEVDACISSELPVFLELRVRYLLSCERVSEAMALAKCCAWHPTAGQHLFFLQVYLTWLFKTSQHDSLHKEVADFSGKDAVHIICSLEDEEKDDLLLALSRAFLSQQLRKGDMYYLCDLVFIWSKLHHRLKTSKEALLEEIRELMLSATNVNTIFPFIRAILQEVGEDGIQFCVELCVNALGSCLPCDVITKSLIYKTIASLLPNDLEVCRACALLVFFVERTVEAYKIVYLLYMHPDQEYHVELSPIRNHVRFETLQVLKKDLYFDPEFWNLIALRTNCLKLMSEKVVSAALDEIMEDKWILNYCTKEPALRSRKTVCQRGRKGALQASAKKQHHNEDTDMATKRFKVGPGKTRLSVDHTVKRKGNHRSRHLKDVSSEPLRRSFWQLERLRDNGGYGEHRRTTRLSEKNPPKRRIRKPKWLLEDSGTLEENNVPQKIKRHGLRLQRHHQLSVEKTPESGQIKNDAKHKLSVNSHLMARENNSKHQKGLSLDSPQPANPPQVILELSLPDNELMGSFNEDTCNRQRGFPQVLLYKPTVKIPATPPPVKTVHRKEVVLRARDASMFLQQLHCYARRPKGKGNGLNIQGSVSTITRSSVQGSPPKSPHGEISEKPEFPSHTPAAGVPESPVLEKAQTQKAVSRKTSSAGELSEKSAVKVNVPVSSQTRATGKVLQTRTRELHKKSEMKLASASQISAATEATESPILEKALQAQTRELCEESAVEMKVTIASQAPTVGKVTQSPGLDTISKAQTVRDSSKTSTSAELPQTVDSNQMGGSEENASKIGAADPMLPQSQDVVHRDGRQLELNSQAEIGYPGVHTTVSSSISEMDVSPKRSENDTTPGGTRVARPRDQDNINDISALTLVTEVVTELAPEKLAHKQPPPEDSASKESKAGSKAKVPHKSHTTSSCSVPYLGASAGADVQGMTEGIHDFDPETPENSEPIETEESRLEYCCTFCNKVFKGSRVVAHAMFHYRRDECMFCGTMFKDDLLAMMHLSNHIEKLKRIKELPGNKAQENCVSDTKDFSTPETSAKDKTTNMSSGRRGRGRPRKSAVPPNSISLPDSTPTGPRKLRSNDKPMDGLSLPEKKQNAPKHLNSQTPVHKVNGHIGKKKEPDRRKKDAVKSEAKLPRRQQEITGDGASSGAENPRLQENRDAEMDSTTSVQVVKDFICSTDNKMKKTGSLKVPKTAIKQDGKEKNVDPQEKVCCPVDGCGWFTDLSKNRVALLYHALNDHDGEVRPLQLAFRIGNNKCSICMRVLWSFEHFQHHVERHRLSPRHPCPHQGCTARFKTGMEMRRHARRHIPLQAVCCLPGCSKLFICLWALNLHEREHYASKSTKPNKITNKQTGGKHNNTPTVKKQLDHKPADETATTTVTKAVSFKATRKSRGRATRNLTGKHDELLSSTTTRASLSNQELKGSNETKDSDVLKNLSNKHTSAEPSGPNLRLKQTFKQKKAKNAALKSHKVLSSSLLHNIKVRHKFKKGQVKVNTQGPKRRGRPPKFKKAVHDENITTGQDSQEMEQKSSTPNVKEEVKDKEKSQHVQDVVRTTDASISESKAKKSTSKQIKKDPVKQRGVSHNTPKPDVTVNSSNQSTIATSADITQKSTVDKMKKLQKAKKRSATKDIGTASSDCSKSKKQKVTNGIANTKIKKKCPSTEQESASSDSAAPQVEPKTAAAPVENSADEDGKTKAENTDSTQHSSGNSVPAVQGNGINEVTATPTISGEKTHKVTTEEKSKKTDIMKKEGKKEKGSRTASSGSGKTNKRHNDLNKKGDKKLVKEKQPCKDASKTVKKTGSPAGEGQAKEETLNATLNNSVSVATACGLNDATSQLTAAEKDTQKGAKKEKSKKPQVPKNLDPNKANKKRKVVHKEGETKTVKKKCKDQGDPSVLQAAKSNAKVTPATVPSSAAEEGKVSAETPQLSPSNCPGYSMIMNGQASSEDSKSTVCKEALAEYGKKPYMRPPPTAYLDERYTTMPKRRKEMSFSPPSQRSVEQAKATPALQRQRCANCFATFNSAEDLQSHLQQQKCSNIFGFDSDDEGCTIE
ncbi:uncharacterized protein LOC119015399 [Acanthopagrus latus]|uniref:uncharacterized protein LOC119015399 n=1 Tax=Acanthopagrus latus TaxID=8177 RepID=UPI00187C7784|nr:uncharacterized protein LOC119015399 [Acanthopagrus latus]